MIRALVVRGIRQHGRLIAALCAGLVLFEGAVVWAAASIGMGPEFQQLMTTLFPANVVDTIFSQFGFASFSGAISFGYQHPVTLVISVAIVTVLATVPAHERETGFLDLVLSRPLARGKYLAATTILLAIGSALPPIALLLGSAWGLEVVEASEGLGWKEYLPAAGVLALLLVTVGSYTLFFTSAAKRRGTAIAQSVGVTLVFYWLDFMGDYWDVLETPRLFSPFHYFDPAVAAGAGVPLGHLLVLSGITLTCTAAAFWNFSRQDL
ncbi:MAG: hypothetical protein HKO65_13930 [Gemmatimonadetes bacterium]|nr:ABC transporter permease [Gemmatimonadota bacterium]NNM06184.1 hypothetical protein [Gemmatimonadota bacterium]